ncbi:MAG: TVP38/TMEM64 family protein [Clostridiaceae bacterium]|nr:TVP38/TMEM64 family protein [Clostridiaceae bacterium]
MKNKDGKSYKMKNYIVLFLILLLISVVLIKYGSQFKYIDFKYLKRFIKSYGKFSFLCFIIIYSLKPIILVVPTSLLTILAGNIFGPFIGLSLSMFSSFMAASLAFFLARFLGKPFVDKIIGEKALKLDENIEKNGFMIMLLMRLSIVFPYDALSYASGLTKIKYRDYILGTMLGILPEMAVYSFMGKNISHPLSIRFILPMLSVIILALISFYVYKNYKKLS